MFSNSKLKWLEKCSIYALLVVLDLDAFSANPKRNIFL